jgi:hypothetical protein
MGTPMNQRASEPPKVRFRTKRVFRENGNWYFSTRECIDVGPYRTELEATVEADILMNLLRDAPLEEVRKVIREFAFEAQMANTEPDRRRQGELTDYVVRESATNLTINGVLGH